MKRVTPQGKTGAACGLPPESPFHGLARRDVLIETRHCIGFLDKFPVSRGHALVVAKIVTESLFDLPVAVQDEIWETVRVVRQILMERFRPDGFNIGANDGSPAGQTVPHAHVHIIPRYRGDLPDPRGGIRWVLPEKARYWK